ncbi:MAG: hypothetical protein HUJ65_06405, partial [Oscillospiraceae bacterium]|nr:hypothetical protein [Oscillospiraceae bacterium]
AYLPGYFADKYDVDADTCSKRADDRCRESAISALEDTLGSYDGYNVISENIRIKNGTAKYALMPVWLLNTKWNGESYLFAMNGQTGKLIGDLPVSMKKFWLYFAAITVPLAAIITLLLGL